MKTENRGFTLIELIVVIAILAIVAGFAGVSLTTLTGARAKKAAASTDALLSRCRMGCMSKTGSSYLSLSVKDGKYTAEYYESGATAPTDSFTADTGVTVQYKTSSALTDLDGTTVKIAFQRDSGELATTGDYKAVTALTFTSGRTYTITVVPDTGAHWIGGAA